MSTQDDAQLAQIAELLSVLCEEYGEALPYNDAFHDLVYRLPELGAYCF